MKIRWENRYSNTSESDDRGRWARIASIGKFRWTKGKRQKTVFELAWVEKLVVSKASGSMYSIRYKFPDQGVYLAKSEQEAKLEVERAWRIFKQETSWWRGILNKLSR